MIDADAYQRQVLEKLKTCADPRHAREILSEAESALRAGQLSITSQKAFWQNLNHDLNLFTHQLGRPAARWRIGPGGAVAAAQAAIGQYQRQLRSDG